MASNLGFTIGKAMLYWPGPNDDLLDSSGSSRTILDLKIEDETFYEFVLWDLENNRLASFIP